jgi:RNA polymerase sigma-70 factor (ECF subfamily)
MPAAEAIFLDHRPRLLALAYRMLGSVAEAEDILQEAWLRWQAADGIADPAAWLVTVVTRLGIDRLRAAEAARRAYAGPWLPEPWIGPAPDAALERAGDLSMAFLVLLERLSPPERAALLLRDTLDADYPEIAATLGRSEAATRQIVHRARERLRAPEARRKADPAEHRRLLDAFLAASREGEEALRRLFVEDAAFVADGGGRVRAARNVIHGAERVARFVVGVRRRWPAGLVLEPRLVNGLPGLVWWLEGRPWGVLSLAAEAGRIRHV